MQECFFVLELFSKTSEKKWLTHVLAKPKTYFLKTNFIHLGLFSLDGTFITHSIFSSNLNLKLHIFRLLEDQFALNTNMLLTKDCLLTNSILESETLPLEKHICMKSQNSKYARIDTPSLKLFQPMNDIFDNVPQYLIEIFLV